MKNYLKIIIGAIVAYLLYLLVKKPLTPQAAAEKIIWGGSGGGSIFIPVSTPSPVVSSLSVSASLPDATSKVGDIPSAVGGSTTPVTGGGIPLGGTVTSSSSTGTVASGSPSIGGGGFIMPLSPVVSSTVPLVSSVSTTAFSAPVSLGKGYVSPGALGGTIRKTSSLSTSI